MGENHNALETKHQLDCISIRKECQMAVKMMTKKRFPTYKNHIKSLVDKKRLEGNDWRYLNSYITNLIAHDNRYALTGKQVKELLDLAI